MKPRKGDVEKKGAAYDGNNNTEDLYNYDDSEEEGDRGNDNIELKAKIDTDDEEFDDGDGVSWQELANMKKHLNDKVMEEEEGDSEEEGEVIDSVSNSPRSDSHKRERKVSPPKSSKHHSKSGSSKKEAKHSDKAPSSSTGSSSERTSSRIERPTSSASNLDIHYDAEYWKRMAQRSKDSFHDPTDKELFIENIWKNIKGKELPLCMHKHSTDCILWFVENVQDTAVHRKLAEGLAVEKLSVETLLDEQVAAVLESLVEVIIRLLMAEEEKDYDSSTARWCIKYLDALAKLVEGHLVELLGETVNGVRLVIVVMEAIGGIRIGRHWSRQNMRFGSGVKVNLQMEIEKDISFKELPGPFKHHLKRFAKCLVLDCPEDDIRDLLFGRATQVAQYLLFVLKIRYPELCQNVVKKLVEIIFDRRSEDREAIVQSASSAYIVEIIMMVASETRLSKIWSKHLKGTLSSLWRHDIANFIVQRLIDAIKEENLFAEVCAEIFPDLNEIFKCNRAGIGVCLTKACQDFRKMQPDMINAMLKAYDCYEPKGKQLDLIPSLLFVEVPVNMNNGGRFGPGNGSNYSSGSGGGGGSKIQIWLHGSLMLQYMLAFDDPHKVTKSLLSLSTDEIVKIAMDRSGSHVIDSFIHGDSVPLKHKSDLVERFLGRYHQLSLDKFGSRIVENIITLSDHSVKKAILEELSAKEATLNSNRHGWFVAKKVGLHTFKNRPDDWRNAFESRERKKRAFGEFLGGPLGPSRGQGPTGTFGSYARRGRFT